MNELMTADQAKPSMNATASRATPFSLPQALSCLLLLPAISATVFLKTQHQLSVHNKHLQVQISTHSIAIISAALAVEATAAASSVSSLERVGLLDADERVALLGVLGAERGGDREDGHHGHGEEDVELHVGGWLGGLEFGMGLVLDEEEE